MSTFPFDPHAPVILVPVIVAGPLRQHMVKMILDTGATFTMIAPEILIEIGADPAQSVTRRLITTASGVEHVPFVTLPTITAFGVTRANVEVCAHSLPTNIPARGLLGLNFLRQCHLHLNFRAGTIAIVPE